MPVAILAVVPVSGVEVVGVAVQGVIISVIGEVQQNWQQRYQVAVAVVV